MDIQHGGQDHTVARCFESGYFTFYDSPIEEIVEVTKNLRILVFHTSCGIQIIVFAAFILVFKVK